MIFEENGQLLSLKEFEQKTGVRWISTLEFESEKLKRDLQKKNGKLYKKGELTLEQVWLGKYFQEEISSPKEPKVAIRYINPQLGWGVFALQDLKKMQFIAEYVGKIRKRSSRDKKNAYCFEYLLAHDMSSSYTIDAMEQGGLSRYLNHSNEPNLESALATQGDLSHVIFYTKKQVAKGSQLCYDYGPDYWSKRQAPSPL